MRNLIAVLSVAVALTVLAAYGIRPSKAKPQVSAPLGTPEAPEIRNDTTKPLQILSASCLRSFEEKKPRCTATIQFSKTGGPWYEYTLLWTFQYDNGHIYYSTWTAEGRLPNGIITDKQHFKPGQVLTVGDKHLFGRKLNGRQMDLTNAAVEVKEVRSDMLVVGGTGGGGHR